MLCCVADRNRTDSRRSAKRQAREDRERRERDQRADQYAQQELEWEYEAYREAEVDRYIAANPAAFETLKNAKWEEDRQKYRLQPRAWRSCPPGLKSKSSCLCLPSRNC